MKPDNYFMCPYCSGCGLVNYRDGVNALYTCQDCYKGFALGTRSMDFEKMINDYCLLSTVYTCVECESPIEVDDPSTDYLGAAYICDECRADKELEY